MPDEANPHYSAMIEQLITGIGRYGCIEIYRHTYRKASSQTIRQADRRTDRQTDRQTAKMAAKQTDR